MGWVRCMMDSRSMITGAGTARTCGRRRSLVPVPVPAPTQGGGQAARGRMAGMIVINNVRADGRMVGVSLSLSPEMIVAGVSAVLSVFSGALSARTSRRARQFEYEIERRRKQEDAAETAERILRLYRDPLLDAAHTLQGRFYNIMAQNYLGRFLHHPDPDERRYARDYTVYAIAEYLCWVEILRRELRFLDLGDVKRNRDLNERLTSIQYAFQRHDIPPQFMVFRGRQRAIAELMMVPSTGSEGPRTECLGYATFSRRLEAEPEFAAWFTRLQGDVETVAESTAESNVRLTYVQRELIDLIDFLDPDRVRLPAAFRARLPEPRTPAEEPVRS
jgi:hypothetical protein